MKQVGLRDRLLVVSVMLGLITAGVRAGEIVPGLDDGSALKDYTIAYAGGEWEIDPDITTGQITLAARFNPDVSQSSGGPYIILEIGGTSNGTGLYLADGHVVFVSRTGTGPAVPPESMADTDFAVISNERTIAVELGSVTFGSENVVYASMDLVAGELICSVNGVLNSYTIVNTANTNFDGNESICFLTKGSTIAGWMGGLHELSGSAFPLLYAAGAASMTQTAGYNNQRGQIFAAAVNNEDMPYTIQVTESNGTIVKEGGAENVISIRLSDDPANYPVTIILTASDPDQIQVAPSQLVFDTNIWQTEQNVTLTAVDDVAQEPRIHVTTLQFLIQVDSASPYSGYLIDSVTVHIEENDCGLWGHGQIDTNRDCQIDIEDFLSIVSNWLECSFPKTGCADYRP